MIGYSLMGIRTWLLGPLAIAGCVVAGSGLAEAKPWKGAELITHETFRFGAFEARIRAARGSGMITPFFLWKNGSELPGALWQEQDFEIFGRDGFYQTQLMTPGKGGSVRTEHVKYGRLPIPAYERYYTYRMEWTPEYMAFYIDNQLVRRETSMTEFAKFMDPAQAEAAQLRVSLWAGDFAWSSKFDPTAVPQAVFVNWIQVYRYTPDTGPGGSDFTSYWRDDFDSVNPSRWWPANWTFDVAVNDYVPQNITAKSGTLVLAFTSESAAGQFPVVPTDDGLEIPLTPPVKPGPFDLPARIEAESYSAFFDSTKGNSGDSSCGTGDVDVQVTRDPAGGYCNVGWITPGEWLEYDVEVAEGATFALSLRASAAVAGNTIRVQIDGLDVSDPLPVPATGWQSFHDVAADGIWLDAGPHVVRLLFDTGGVNVNYLVFSGGTAPECLPSTHTYQAESMTATTGGPIPGGWNLWSNGSISTTHAFQAGDAVVRVRALGQPALGIFPHMIVSVGGQTIGDTVVGAASYASYDYAYAALAGSREVKVTFDNDYYAGGQDRNLVIDYVSIDACPP